MCYRLYSWVIPSSPFSAFWHMLDELAKFRSPCLQRFDIGPSLTSGCCQWCSQSMLSPSLGAKKSGHFEYTGLCSGSEPEFVMLCEYMASLSNNFCPKQYTVCCIRYVTVAHKSQIIRTTNLVILAYISNVGKDARYVPLTTCLSPRC